LQICLCCSNILVLGAVAMWRWEWHGKPAERVRARKSPAEAGQFRKYHWQWMLVESPLAGFATPVVTPQGNDTK
jgi:hypothetical protein